MKKSTFLFFLAGCALFILKASGTAGVISMAVIIISLVSIGAFLLVNGH